MLIEDIEWVNPTLKLELTKEAPSLEASLGISVGIAHRLGEAMLKLTKDLDPNGVGNVSNEEMIAASASVCETANEFAWIMIKLGGFYIEAGHITNDRRQPWKEVVN